MSISKNMTTSDREAEQEADQEANQFAMALLMPEEWVRKEVRKIGPIDLCDDQKLKALANKFQVPLTLMAIRIGQIYKPCK